MYKKTLSTEPLTQDELRRITEINFKKVCEKLIETVGNYNIAQQHMSLIAYKLNLVPSDLFILVEKALTNIKLPSQEELIEIYYRSDYPRSEVRRLAKCRNSYITEVMTRVTLDNMSEILPPVLAKTETKFLKEFTEFYATIGGETL